jgi:predicted dithiol-disulfide oxidoreductase (DUF899 family)
VKVEKDYAFDGPREGKSSGTCLTAEASGGGHFMFGPDWEEGCPSCSFNMDHTDGALVHLAQRDVSFVAISRAPFEKIAAFKKRMGWKFPWVSSLYSDFNYDYHVSFTKEELATGKVNYNFEMAPFPSSEGPGSASSTRTRTETSITRIPCMRAVRKEQ